MVYLGWSLWYLSMNGPVVSQLWRICRESSPSNRTSDFPDAFTPYSQDRTVGAATRLWNGLSGVQVPPMDKRFSHPQIRPDCGFHPASYTGVVYLGVKRQERGVERSPSPNAKVMNEGGLTPIQLPLYAFMTWTMTTWLCFHIQQKVQYILIILYHIKLSFRHCGGRKIHKRIIRPVEYSKKLRFLSRVSTNTNSDCIIFLR